MGMAQLRQTVGPIVSLLCASRLIKYKQMIDLDTVCRPHFNSSLMLVNFFVLLRFKRLVLYVSPWINATFVNLVLFMQEDAIQTSWSKLKMFAPRPNPNLRHHHSRKSRSKLATD